MKDDIVKFNLPKGIGINYRKIHLLQRVVGINFFALWALEP
ncbi:MAG: hypothetical protein RLZZ04_4400 [Cyanobacteriota bacterium]|jgi:hypothetical protein